MSEFVSGNGKAVVKNLAVEMLRSSLYAKHNVLTGAFAERDRIDARIASTQVEIKELETALTTLTSAPPQSKRGG